MKCKCSMEIPEGRYALGYRTCLSCSTETARACIDIITHKTGNTIEQCSPETAAAIRKAGRRSGFGAAAGMRAGSERPMRVKITRRPMPARARVATLEELEAIGSECIHLIEHAGLDAMQKYLAKQVARFACDAAQARRIETACTALFAATSIKYNS